MKGKARKTNLATLIQLVHEFRDSELFGHFLYVDAKAMNKANIHIIRLKLPQLLAENLLQLFAFLDIPQRGSFVALITLERCSQSIFLTKVSLCPA